MGFVYKIVILQLYGLNFDYFRFQIEYDYYEYFILKIIICVYICIVCDFVSIQVSLKCNIIILMLVVEENLKIYDINIKGKNI